VHNIDVWKVRIQVLLEAFTQMAAVTDAESYVLYLFWLALALLESSPLTHSYLFCGGMELLTAVIVCDSFLLFLFFHDCVHVDEMLLVNFSSSGIQAFRANSEDFIQAVPHAGRQLEVLGPQYPPLWIAAFEQV
jgi:hypothetical protein